MGEYYLEDREYFDLKQAIAEKDISWIESIVHHMEMRNVRIKIAKGAMRVKANMYHNSRG